MLSSIMWEGLEKDKDSDSLCLGTCSENVPAATRVTSEVVWNGERGTENMEEALVQQRSIKTRL